MNRLKNPPTLAGSIVPVTEMNCTAGSSNSAQLNTDPASGPPLPCRDGGLPRPELDEEKRERALLSELPLLLELVPRGVTGEPEERFAEHGGVTAAFSSTS